MNMVCYKGKKLFFLGLVILILSSCKTSFGEKYERGNLDIYYSGNVGFEYVEALADYYEKNGLIQENQHTIQLTSNSKSFLLNIILTKKKDETILYHIELLEKDLQETVFKDRNFKIQLCDTFFNVKKG